MKIAVLGTGFGAYHVELYKKIGLVKEIVVWGRNTEKLEELKEKFGVSTTTKCEDILNDKSICLVDICMPNALHKEMALKAMAAGKDVFLEMPLAETEEDGRQIIEAAKKSGRRVFVDLFLRHEFAYEYLAAAVQKERFGKCRELHVKRQTPPWWGNLDVSRIGLNLMHHDIDFVSQLFGKGKAVHVSGRNVRENQSVVTAVFDYADKNATVYTSSAMPDTCPFSVGYEAVFENGFVRYYEDSYADGRLDTKLEVFTANKQEEVALQIADCYEAVCRDVLESVAEKKPSVLDGEHALMTLEMICEMNRKLEGK